MVLLKKNQQFALEEYRALQPKILSTTQEWWASHVACVCSARCSLGTILLIDFSRRPPKDETDVHSSGYFSHFLLIFFPFRQCAGIIRR